MRLLSPQSLGRASTRAFVLPLLRLALAAPSYAQDAVPALADAASAATSATSAGTTGDWATYKGDAQRTSARNIALPLPLNLVWRHSAAVEAGTSTAPLVIGSGAARRIYFAAGPTVFCLEGETGAAVWKSQVLTRPVTAPLLYVPNAPGGGMIVAVTSGGQIAALRVSDGGQVWTAEARAPIPLAAPVLARTPQGERLILSLATGRLVAYTLEGVLDPQWRVDALNPQIRVSPNATPALSADGSRLLLPAQDQRLYSIDVARAKVDYSIQLPAASTSSPLILGDQVVVSSGEIVTGYRLRTGDPIWRFNMGGRQVSASPAGLVDAQGRPIIYIGAPTGTFYAIEGTKGGVLWKRELGEAVTGTASITNNAVVVGTSRGVVFALNPLDGAVVWQYRLRTERNPAAPVANTRQRRGGAGNAGFGAEQGFGGANGQGEGFSEGDVLAAEDGGQGRGRGRGQGGFGRGRFGRQEVLQTYGVSAPPVIVDGQAYIMGDNVAVYCFDTQAFDAAPPRVVEPSVSVPSAEGALATLEIQGARTPLVPGKAPMYFAAQIDDAGSGLDPASVQVQWNDAPLPAANVSYSAGTSVLTVTLNQKDAAGLATSLADGTYTIKLTGRDYAGNPMSYTGRIRVDNTRPPPSQNTQPQRGRRNRGNQRGNQGGGFQGGGFQGGGFQGGGFQGGGNQGGGNQGGDQGGFQGGAFPDGAATGGGFQGGDQGGFQGGGFPGGAPGGGFGQ